MEIGVFVFGMVMEIIGEMAMLVELLEVSATMEKRLDLYLLKLCCSDTI